MYSSGYLLIHVQDRYIWPVIILLMFCGFYLLDNLHHDKILGLKLLNVFIIIIMFSFITAPAVGLITYPIEDVNSYSLSEVLETDYHIHGNIASNDLWEQTNRISFYLNSQYYGLPKNINNSQELENELKRNDIDYYFVWGNSSFVNMTTYKEITNNKLHDLKIYSNI